jgi:transposase-like protein
MLKGTVEVDETYVGGRPRPGSGERKRGRGPNATDKAPVMVFVERDGNAHSQHVERVTGETLTPTIRELVNKSSTICTDESSVYRTIGQHFDGGHQKVNYSGGQYVNASGAHVNTAESFFALIKRGHYGVFHQLSKKQLRRYCDEFSFRWNGRTLTDTERRDEAVNVAEGKRLYYKTPIN